MSKETVMFIRVSENCNAGCFMCGFAHTNNSYNITFDDVNKILDYMDSKKSYEMVRFTGGEPLLHPEIDKLVNMCHNKGYKTSIISNGFLLPKKADVLAKAGLDQIILSTDGSKSEIHDELRGLKNGLEHIKLGVKELRKYNENIIIRANTVISRRNIDDLLDMYKMFNSLSFDSWSIIPIRGNDAEWKIEDLNHYKDILKDFKEMQKKYSKPKLLGYSSDFNGKTEEEIEASFVNNYRLVPKDKCELVDYIRFYIPNQELLIPCNCAAHRINQIETDYNIDELSMDKKADIMAKWLKENGPTKCIGCEPINAYYGDYAKELKLNIFNY